MARLLVFAPCERVIVNDQDNTVSLITLFRELTLSIAPGSRRPTGDAIIPMRWWVLTLWNREDDDDHVVYRQRIELLNSANESVLQFPPNTFEIQRDVAEQRVVSNINYFPVGFPGQMRLVLHLKRNDEPEREITSYPMNVRYADEQANPPEEAE